MFRTRSEIAAEIEALRGRLANLEDRSAPSVSEKATPGTSPPMAEPIEVNLRASEVRYRRLFETAKDGILILDVPPSRRGATVSWSPKRGSEIRDGRNDRSTWLWQR